MDYRIYMLMQSPVKRNSREAKNIAGVDRWNNSDSMKTVICCNEDYLAVAPFTNMD